MRTLTCLLLLTALASLTATAATYRWVDKDGNVHYSDQKQPGAKEVDLKPITEVPAEVPPPSAAPTAPAAASATGDDIQYTQMTIVSPKDQDTLRGAGIGLSIQVQLDPPLGGDDSIEYELDGKPVGQRVEYIERGTHTVSARVVSKDGSTKISAGPVTFFVFQNIAKPPPPPKKK